MTIGEIYQEHSFFFFLTGRYPSVDGIKNDRQICHQNTYSAPADKSSESSEHPKLCSNVEVLHFRNKYSNSQSLVL